LGDVVDGWVFFEGLEVFLLEGFVLLLALFVVFVKLVEDCVVGG
jgi:hypothetical protein